MPQTPEFQGILRLESMINSLMNRRNIFIPLCFPRFGCGTPVQGKDPYGVETQILQWMRIAGGKTENTCLGPVWLFLTRRGWKIGVAAPESSNTVAPAHPCVPCRGEEGREGEERCPEPSDWIHSPAWKPMGKWALKIQLRSSCCGSAG